MSLHRYDAKRDLSEKPIIEALQAVGCTVLALSIKGAPDLLVGYTDFEGYRANILMEVKTGKAKLRTGQEEWIGNWAGNVVVVRSIEDALQAVGK